MADNRVAVVGIACRFPGSDGAAAFWRNLKEGRDCITYEGQLYPRGLFPDPAGFPCGLFGLSGLDALKLSLQKRNLLWLVWSALEDAGYGASCGKLRTSLYLGQGSTVHPPERIGESPLSYDRILEQLKESDPGYLSSHISYLLDLKGESITLQCACATSLFCVHFACQSLLTYQSDLAIAGGALIQENGALVYKPSSANSLSRSGKTRPYDQNADGFVVGNGAGVIVLRRLVDAVAAKDRIYGVIRGSAVNNDGRRKAGYEAPSSEGISRVLRDALLFSEVEADSVGYIEGHGTGTVIGDTLEVKALIKVLATARPISLGSVKANVGHLGEASGMASLIKVLQMLNHGQIVPQINHERALDELGGKLVVDTRMRIWERGQGASLAMVSGYSVGGNNAAFVLEPGDAELSVSKAPRPGCLLFPISARNPAELTSYRSQLSSWLRDEPGIDLISLAFSLCRQRSWSCRFGILARELDELRNGLESDAPAGTIHYFGRVMDCPDAPASAEKIRLDTNVSETELLNLLGRWVKYGECDLVDIFAALSCQKIAIPDPVGELTDLALSA